MANANSNYRYFLFSQQFIADKNKVYDKINKTMVLGSVIYNGSRREYCALSATPTLHNYTDARVVAEGDITKISHTQPTTKQKKSNEE